MIFLSLVLRSEVDGKGSLPESPAESGSALAALLPSVPAPLGVFVSSSSSPASRSSLSTQAVNETFSQTPRRLKFSSFHPLSAQVLRSKFNA